jgi:hypothetical protein
MAALAAVEAEFGVTLQAVSAPDAVVYAGPAYFHALERRYGRTILIDCGDRAGDVLACLRTGLRMVLFRGASDFADRLASIASQCGATLAREIEIPRLDPAWDDDLRRFCRRHLDAAPRAATSV